MSLSTRSGNQLNTRSFAETLSQCFISDMDLHVLNIGAKPYLCDPNTQEDAAYNGIVAGFTADGDIWAVQSPVPGSGAFL